MEKYATNEIIKDIKFHCVNDIQTVFDLILDPPLRQVEPNPL